MNQAGGPAKRKKQEGSQTSDSKSKSEEKAGTSNKIAKAELGKAKDLLDDVFDSARIKGKSGAPKKVPPASKTAGPDMEQVKKEASKFLSRGSDQRAVVDGLKIYSEKELEEEMGEGAWEAFQDAADDSLAKGLTSKDYW